MTPYARRVLNYLGYRDNDGDERILREISDARNEILETCGEVKSVKGLWSCDVEPGLISFSGRCFKSESLAGHVAGAKFFCLFAVTLGARADMLINRHGVSNMGRSVVFDAVASVLVDEYCRELSREIAAESVVAGLKATKRFSPGYGDFGLEYQREILNILGAGKRIGLALTEVNMLVPSKSVTAAIGFV